jgi:protein-tyrosine-phosphatase
LRAYSAGLQAGALNPIVVEAMKEAGIHMSRNRTKSVNDAEIRSREYDYMTCPGIIPRLT